jgi:esterase/lipase superfamily enzyme/HEAT repeat protein
MLNMRLTGSALLALLAAQLVFGEEPAKHGISTSQWIQLLGQRDPRQRAQAAESLGELGPQASEAVAALAAALNDSEPNVRLQAATALGRMGASAAGSLPQLTAAVRDENEFARYAARWALGRIGVDLQVNHKGVAESDVAGFVRQLATAEAALREMDASDTAQHLSNARLVLEERIAPVTDEAAPESPDIAVPGPSELAAPDRGSSAGVSTAKDLPADEILTELKQPDSLRRLRAVRELGRLGEAAVPALIEALRAEGRVNEEFGDSIDITTAILQTLQQIGGPAAPALTQALGEDELAYRIGFTLEELGPAAKPALPALIDVVENKENDDLTRSLAADAIGKIGPAARDAVPTLIRVARDEDNQEDLRCSALLSLGHIGGAAREATPHLIQIMGEPLDFDMVRWNAAEALPKIGAPADQAVPALLALCAGKANEGLRRPAIDSLAAYGKAAGEAVPVLVSFLDHEDVYLGAAAAEALGKIGGTPHEAIAPLIRIAEHVDAHLDMQAAAAAALADIGPAAVDALIERLEAAGEHDRARAAATLARIGPRAADAVAPLTQILHNDSDKVRRYAAIALGELGPASRGAVDDLLIVLTDDDQHPQLRGTAATALGELGPVASSALDEMVRMIHDDYVPGNTRAMCALAAAKISPKAVPELMRALESDETVVRIAAARALHSIHLVSKHALPTLLACVEDHQIGFLANWTMQEIGPDAVQYLLETVRDEETDIETRRAAVEMLGDLFYGDDLHQEAAPVLIDALRNEHLRDAAEYALSSLGADSIPIVLAILDEEERLGDGDSPFCETLRSLAVELCIPTGRGGGSCLEEEMTGFAKYDDLGIYSVPPAMAGERAMESFSEKMAEPYGEEMVAPYVEETLTPIVEESAMPVAEESAAPGEESHAGSLDSSANENAGPPVDEDEGYETVKVFYGTNRMAEEETSTATPNTRQLFFPAAIAGLATMFFGLFGYIHSKARFRAIVACMGLVLTVTLAYGSFVTVSRIEQAASKPGPKYGNKHSDVVEMGVCQVSIPERHELGKLESPSVVRLEVREDPQKHVMLRYVERRDPDQFFDELRSDLGRRGDSILIFVHGYNVTFEDAARRTAQMAYDLEFAGAPMFYSWPSQGSWYRYREDEKYVELAVDHIKQFLVDVARRSQAKSIHLIAHSMGNRGLTAALREIEVDAGDRGALFNQVVLAAPDINADIFKARIAPAIVKRAEQVTMYASSNDLALAASRVFNAGGPRAGDATDGPVVVPGIETIDVSNVDDGLLGHLYYGSNRAILDDLKQILHQSRSADRRARLDAVAHGNQKYWVCRHPETANDSSPVTNHRR